MKLSTTWTMRRHRVNKVLRASFAAERWNRRACTPVSIRSHIPVNCVASCAIPAFAKVTSIFRLGQRRSTVESGANGNARHIDSNGPSPAKHTPAPKPRSSRAGIKRMQESRGRAPGGILLAAVPKMHGTPLFFKHRTMSRADRGLASCSQVFALISPLGKLSVPSSDNSWYDSCPVQTLSD